MSASASVEVLSAEVRVLQVGDGQITPLCTGNSTKQPFSLPSTSG